MAKKAKGNHNLLDQLLETTPPSEERFVENSMKFNLLIQKIMVDKNISATKIAKALNKTTPEVSRWINGNNNFTLRTISKLEEALGEDLITVNYSLEDAEKEEPTINNQSLRIVHSSTADENTFNLKNEELSSKKYYGIAMGD